MLKLTDSSLCSELQACLNMTVGRFLFFCLDTKETKNQNWFLGNYSAALRNVRFFLKIN
jgi:hypothetical protein